MYILAAGDQTWHSKDLRDIARTWIMLGMTTSNCNISIGRMKQGVSFPLTKRANDALLQYKDEEWNKIDAINEEGKRINSLEQRKYWEYEMHTIIDKGKKYRSLDYDMQPQGYILAFPDRKNNIITVERCTTAWNNPKQEKCLVSVYPYIGNDLVAWTVYSTLEIALDNLTESYQIAKDNP